MNLPANRLMSLDAFRGLTIAFMILVNTPGTWQYIYYPLRHAKWHGCTPTDLVFPFFLFIVGVSMYYSFSKYGHRLTRTVTLKILRRTGLIFLVGLLLNWFPFYTTPFAELRIMGVLQRIAFAFGGGAFICLSVPHKHLPSVGGAILIIYWLLLGLGGAADPYALETNFVRQVDLWIFGEGHIWDGFGIPFDPEGLISTIPAVVTVIIGFWFGQKIKMQTNRDKLVKELLFYGFLGIFFGLLWDKVFPINKALWTSSYVLYTAGIAAVMLGIFIEIIDIRGQKWFTPPLIVFGTNPLIAYVFSGVLYKIMYHFIRWEDTDGAVIVFNTWLYTDVFQPVFGNFNGSLMFAVTYVGVCWLLTWGLYKNKIFIKI